MDFRKKIIPPEDYQKFELEGKFVWCGSAVKNKKDGKYYLFFSYWDKKKQFKAWVSHSKIGIAVSDSPEGPYSFYRNMNELNNQSWCEDMTHNPTVKEYDGKYYLYYVGTRYDKPGPDVPAHLHPARDNQQIGVAVADSPSGEWMPFEGNPVLKPRENHWDNTYVTNPSIYFLFSELV